MIRIIFLSIFSTFVLQVYAQRCGTPAVDMPEIKLNDLERYQLLFQKKQQVAILQLNKVDRFC